MPEGQHDKAELYLLVEGLDNQVKATRQHGEAELEALKELMEARFNERDRLMDHRFLERDRAVEVASEEREKAASALRDELARAINEGDDRLREHITNQIQQIRDALASANELELARIAACDAKIVSVAEKLTLVHESSEEAVKKAETAVDKRLEGMNELRAQIEGERGRYATKDDLAALGSRFDTAMKPVEQFMTESRARQQTIGDVKDDQRAGIGTVLGIVGGATAVVSIVVMFSNGVFTPDPAPTGNQPAVVTVTTP